ncbi:SOSS complex subunit B2 isoform X2 [Schistocerca gregaria]|uniref:SOSS complex subunit B2 isoform X2 n=1 Tax=Schistocerca gregaria TaxID=7010 RepID=UPI00211DAAF0|nr:SOSS complex subunit B2 isoform X2 [Schistocerca gregaria]
MASQSSSSIPITKIIDMKPGMKNLNVMFIVLERGSTTKTKEGGIIVQHLVADSTASITASLWDEKGEALQPGDIFIMNGGYASLYKTSLMLYCSRYGSIERVGEAIKH